MTPRIHPGAVKDVLNLVVPGTGVTYDAEAGTLDVAFPCETVKFQFHPSMERSELLEKMKGCVERYRKRWDPRNHNPFAKPDAWEVL